MLTNSQSERPRITGPLNWPQLWNSPHSHMHCCGAVVQPFPKSVFVPRSLCPLLPIGEIIWRLDHVNEFYIALHYIRVTHLTQSIKNIVSQCGVDLHGYNLNALLTLCSYVMIKGSFGTVQMVAVQCSVAGLYEVFIQSIKCLPKAGRHCQLERARKK